MGPGGGGVGNTGKPTTSPSAPRAKRALLLWADGSSTLGMGAEGRAGLNLQHQEIGSLLRAPEHCTGEELESLLKAPGSTAPPDPTGLHRAPDTALLASSLRRPLLLVLGHSLRTTALRDMLLKRLAFQENNCKGDKIHLLGKYLHRKRGCNGLDGGLPKSPSTAWFLCLSINKNMCNHVYHK